MWRYIKLAILEEARTYAKATEQKQRRLKGKDLLSTMSNQSETSKQPETTNPLDPFDTLNTMRDASLKSWDTMRNAALDTWSKLMIALVNTEACSQTTGQWWYSYLTLSQLFRHV